MNSTCWPSTAVRTEETRVLSASQISNSIDPRNKMKNLCQHIKRCLWESGQHEIDLLPGLISNTPFLYEGSETNSLRTIKCGAGEEKEDVQIYISTLSGMEIPSLLFSRWSFYYCGFIFAAFVARSQITISQSVVLVPPVSHETTWGFTEGWRPHTRKTVVSS